MRVLVTGASSFLGQHVVSRSLERAQEVRVLNRDKSHLLTLSCAFATRQMAYCPSAILPKIGAWVVL
jgi:nucleoside-diphosphate-sugar epimerase